MDFNETIKQFSQRALSIKDTATTGVVFLSKM